MGGHVSLKTGSLNIADFIIVRNVDVITHPFPRQLISDSGVLETSTVGKVIPQYRTLIFEHDNDVALTAAYVGDGI